VFQGFVGPIGLPLQKCWLPVHLDTMQTSVCKGLMLYQAFLSLMFGRVSKNLI
jgi:hypothetical protein